VAVLKTAQREVDVVGTLTTGITPVEARVCTECGYMALYAQNPSVLRPAPAASATPEP